MSRKALGIILRLADAPSSASLTCDDVMRWLPEERALLTSWLRDGGHRSWYTCTACEAECTEEVQWVEAAEHPEAFIPCPGGLGRVGVRPEELRQWVVDAGLIAGRLGELLAPSAAPDEVVKDRLWWLGRPTLGGRPVPVFVARGAGRHDAAATFGQVAALREAPCLVLCFADSPAAATFGAEAKVVSLSRLLRIEDAGVTIDAAALGLAAPRSRARVTAQVVPIHAPSGTKWGQVMVEFLDDETVRVSVPGHVEQRSFVEMGFQDRRQLGEQADLLWGMLRLLAKEQGRLTPDDSRRVVSAASFGKVKKYVADIRARLHALFPDIGGDPFKSYRKVKAYETEFILRWAGGRRRG